MSNAKGQGESYVKPHARTASAGSTDGSGRKARGLFGLACACVLGLAAFLGSGASSAGAVEAFPGQGFLPDNRAWELVSPPDKNGGDVMLDAAHTRAATDGSAVVFSSLSGFSDTAGSGVATEYIAVRNDQGWATHAITPPQEAMSMLATFQGIEPQWVGEFSPDLSTGIFRSWSPLQANLDDPNVAYVSNLYQRDDLLTPGAGNYSLVSPCPACGSPLAPIQSLTQLPRLAGISGDFAKLTFESRLKLVSSAPASSSVPKLYQWTNEGLIWIGEIPAGTDPSCGGSGPACVLAPRSIAGQSAGGASPSVPRYTPGTLSDDGSRTFFTVGTSNSASTGNLFVRDDQGTTNPADDTTAKINAIESGTGSGSATATFWVASRDGSTVLFSSAQQLTADDTDTAIDVYQYRVDQPIGSRLTLLSVDGEPLDGEGNTQGVIGTSANGDRTYFLATGQLVAGGPSIPGAGIYLWDDGDLRYVGELASGGNDTFKNLTSQGWALDGTRRRARVTPDGRHLLFLSSSGQGLGGYDQTACAPFGCAEFYLYDSLSDELRCVTCNPTGEPATVSADTSVRIATGGTGTGSHLPTSLSDDGKYVFFNTAEKLVPQDHNGTVDPYQYSTATDEVSLLSSGESASRSYVLDASPDGAAVFIATREQLSGWDTDGAYDIYVASVAGGFGEPPETRPGCEGDACQEETSESIDQSAGSLLVESDKGARLDPRCLRKGRQLLRLKRERSTLERVARRAEGRDRRRLVRQARRKQAAAKQLERSSKDCMHGKRSNG